MFVIYQCLRTCSNILLLICVSHNTARAKGFHISAIHLWSLKPGWILMDRFKLIVALRRHTVTRIGSIMACCHQTTSNFTWNITYSREQMHPLWASELNLQVVVWHDTDTHVYVPKTCLNGKERCQLHWFIDWLIDCLVGWLVGLVRGWVCDWWLGGWLVGWLTDWLACWWLADWLAGWLPDFGWLNLAGWLWLADSGWLLCPSRITHYQAVPRLCWAKLYVHSWRPYGPLWRRTNFASLYWTVEFWRMHYKFTSPVRVWDRKQPVNSPGDCNGPVRPHTTPVWDFCIFWLCQLPYVSVRMPYGLLVGPARHCAGPLLVRKDITNIGDFRMGPYDARAGNARCPCGVLRILLIKP